MVQQLRKHREQHAAIHEVFGSRLLCGIDEGNTHRTLKRMERRRVVEDDVDAYERGRERARFEVVPDGERAVGGLWMACFELLDRPLGAHEDAEV